MSHHHKSRHCEPIMYPPQYVVHDCYTPRMVPHIHPIVHVHRENIVNVPQHFYPECSRDIVADQGCPGGGSSCPRQ